METQGAKNKETIQNFMNAIWVKNDLNLALTYVTEDVNYHGVRSEIHGKENYGKMIEGHMTSFKNVTVDLEDMVSENNKVYFRGNLTGIHEGDFEGIKATHKKVKINFFDEMEIEGGKIKNDWDLVDELGLMQQLGIEVD